MSQRPATMLRATNTKTYRLIAGGLCLFTAAVIWGSGGSAAGAKDSVRETKSTQPFVKIFDDVCYSNLPDLAPILTLAKQKKWKAITGLALQAYAPSVKPDKLQAWSFEEGGSTLRVSISTAPVDKALAEALPGFAKSRAFACSLNLPGREPQTKIDKALENLVGRQADEKFDQGPFKVRFWSGITDEIAALLYYYAPKSGNPGGLISFVVLQK